MSETSPSLQRTERDGTRRGGLAAKILFPVLAVTLLGALALFWVMEGRLEAQSRDDLQLRLDHFASLQAAVLTESLWNFDRDTVTHLFASYSSNKELQSIRLFDADGALIAEKAGEPHAVYDNVLTVERSLERSANGVIHHVGRLQVSFHDAQVRAALKTRQGADLLTLATLLLLIAGSTALAVHLLIGRPLAVLQAALRRNADRDSPQPLEWPGQDEIGALIDTYNAVLAEMAERARDLKEANVRLQTENAQRRRVEEKLLLFETAVQTTDQAVMVTDENFVVLEANDACPRMTGFPPEELLGRPLAATLFRDEADDPASLARLQRHDAWSGELTATRRNGKPLPLWVTVNTIEQTDRHHSQHVLILSDISKLKDAETQLKRLAYVDLLTGLPNRSLFLDRLGHEIAVAMRHKRGFALLCIDLDHFKEVNDTLGHAAGDVVLAAAGERMLPCIRAEDTLARVGGDEFQLIMRETADPVIIEQLASKLIEQLRLPFQIAGKSLTVGASIGIALFPSDGSDAETLNRNADLALYMAKNSGRGRYCFFEPGIAERARVRSGLRDDLQRALQNDEFVMHYQPIFNLVDQQPVRLEALLRWQRGDTLVEAGNFIPLAEEGDEMIAIGRWVLNRVFRQMADWQAQGLSTKVAINISRRQFLEAGFADATAAAARQWDVDPARVLLEITEATITTDPDEARAVLGHLIASGFRIAIDDFGTGYSSLSYLVEYPLHLVKLDHSLVHAVDTADQRGRVVVMGLAGLVKRIGLELVAEGVETRQEHEFLVNSGFTMGQGRLYCGPRPADEIGALLRRTALERSLR